jgi:hypothetical protein
VTSFSDDYVATPIHNNNSKMDGKSNKSNEDE